MKAIGIFALVCLMITLGCGTVRDQNAKMDAALTHDYWSQIRTSPNPLIGDFQNLTTPQVADLVQTLKTVAQSIEGLPTTKVDPDAVEAGNAIVAAMRKLATFSEQKLTATTWRAALVGLRKPGPSLIEKTSDETLTLRTFLESSAREVRKAKRRLSIRYGREFPSLDGEADGLTQFWFVSELARIPPEREIAGIRQELKALDRSISAFNLQLGQVLVDAQTQKGLIASLTNRAEIANDPAGKQAILAEIEAKRAVLVGKNREAETVKGQREELMAQRTTLQEREVQIAVELEKNRNSTREQIRENDTSFETEVRKAEAQDRPE